jgi:hypothetical protein
MPAKKTDAKPPMTPGIPCRFRMPQASRRLCLILACSHAKLVGEEEGEGRREEGRRDEGGVRSEEENVVNHSTQNIGKCAPRLRQRRQPWYPKGWCGSGRGCNGHTNEHTQNERKRERERRRERRRKSRREKDRERQRQRERQRDRDRERDRERGKRDEERERCTYPQVETAPAMQPTTMAPQG